MSGEPATTSVVSAIEPEEQLEELSQIGPAIVGRRTLYFNESLARGLKILLLFSSQNRWLSLSDIARQTGVNPATVMRLLGTLERMGFVERSLSRRKYRPGLAVLKLGYSALHASSIRELALPHLERLAQQTGETVNMGVLAETSVLYIVRLKRTELVTADIHVGSTLPAYSSSMGKVLLAHLPQPQLTVLLKSMRLERRGPNTITDRRVLRSALIQIRKQGWALQDEETAAGLRSVSAPIHDRSRNVVAAINIATPTTRVTVDRLLTDLLPPLMETAQAISELVRLGSGPPDS
jgi:IclR family transcriptional regulator, pca regulon regulatory protein